METPGAREMPSPSPKMTPGVARKLRWGPVFQQLPALILLPLLSRVAIDDDFAWKVASHYALSASGMGAASVELREFPEHSAIHTRHRCHGQEV